MSAVFCRDARPTVCHVLHTLQVGGGEMLACDFAREHAAEFRPVFALLDELGTLGERLLEEGCVVEVQRRQPGFDFACARRLSRFFRRESVTFVHAHQYGPLLYSAVARLAYRRIPILFTEHGRDDPDFRRWKRVLANRLLLTKRDRCTAVGEAVRKALISHEGLPPERIDVVYNGRDLSQFAPNRQSRRDVRRELALSEDAFVVIQVARLNRLKDHATAIRAMAQLTKQCPTATLLVVGDGEERGRVQHLVSELNLCGHVRLLGERHDVPSLLSAADAFLLSSVSEGIPLTLIEAMATGMPCVATKVGGVPEVIVDGESGLLAAARDPHQLATHLILLSIDTELRQRIGQAARRRSLAKFDHGSMHRNYRRIYREMLDDRAR